MRRLSRDVQARVELTVTGFASCSLMLPKDDIHKTLYIQCRGIAAQGLHATPGRTLSPLFSLSCLALCISSPP